MRVVFTVNLKTDPLTVPPIKEDKNSITKVILLIIAINIRTMSKHDTALVYSKYKILPYLKVSINFTARY